MLKINLLFSCLTIFYYFGVLACDCFFFGQLFTTLENNIIFIFFFNFFLIFTGKSYCVFNYTNIFINTSTPINENLLNGCINIHPVFFLLLINFILFRYLHTIITLVMYSGNTAFRYYNYYLYLCGFFFMLLGIYWASQELLWGLWWSWDLVEIFLLIVLILLLMHTHFIKFNPLADFYFFKYILLNILLFFFFNKLNIGVSLHNFGSINSDNYSIYFIYFYLVLLFLKYNNYVYIMLLLSFFYKDLYIYALIFILLYDIVFLYYINFILNKSFLFLFVQFLFNYTLKHILILTSIFFYLLSDYVYLNLENFENFFSINQNFFTVKNSIFYTTLFEKNVIVKVNQLFFFFKNLNIYCLNSFFLISFFLVFIFLYFFKKEKKFFIYM